MQGWCVQTMQGWGGAGSACGSLKAAGSSALGIVSTSTNDCLKLFLFFQPHCRPDLRYAPLRDHDLSVANLPHSPHPQRCRLPPPKRSTTSSSCPCRRTGSSTSSHLRCSPSSAACFPRPQSLSSWRCYTWVRRSRQPTWTPGFAQRLQRRSRTRSSSLRSCTLWPLNRTQRVRHHTSCPRDSRDRCARRLKAVASTARLVSRLINRIPTASASPS